MTLVTETYASYAETRPDQMAIINEKESMTYREWYELVQKSAQWLKKVTHQQRRVAFLISNGVSFLQIFAGAASAGWTAIPLDPRWSHAECVEKLILSEAAIVIVEDRYMRMFEKEWRWCWFSGIM
ncbi:AMP-binding protein [Bacillus sp. NPDC093026]|uniref:AMP-binding protein n=1 Tax=Bacillus sp. NPDC093026 TaxID=3363948 RepID=UPI00380370E4